MRHGVTASGPAANNTPQPEDSIPLPPGRILRVFRPFRRSARPPFRAGRQFTVVETSGANIARLRRARAGPGQRAFDLAVENAPWRQSAARGGETGSLQSAANCHLAGAGRRRGRRSACGWPSAGPGPRNSGSSLKPGWSGLPTRPPSMKTARHWKSGSTTNRSRPPPAAPREGLEFTPAPGMPLAEDFFERMLPRYGRRQTVPDGGRARRATTFGGGSRPGASANPAAGVALPPTVVFLSLVTP